MKFTIIVSSENPEILWNAFRFAVLILNQFDDVVLFLNGPAVNYRKADSEKFPLLDLAKTFVLNEGIFMG